MTTKSEFWPQTNSVGAKFFTKDNSFRSAGHKVSLVKLKQIHSSIVFSIDKAPESEVLGQGDGMVTQLKNLALVIQTADCIPLLANDGPVIGACHVGWRGLREGIVENWISTLFLQGAIKTNLKLALGPHIKSCHFEVGEDVAQQLTRIQGASLSSDMIAKVKTCKNSEKSFINLQELVLLRLEMLGISRGQVFCVNECTFCQPKKYFSYRRDGPSSGRLESVIWLNSESLNK